jgi:transcriptional regulator with XRE-family HTH domain
MNETKPPRSAFPKALKTARLARGMSQEDFSVVSSRTYVSSLERGIKEPTMSKVDQLADAMNIHPLALLFLSYISDKEKTTVVNMIDKVSRELFEILNFDQNEDSK